MFKFNAERPVVWRTPAFTIGLNRLEALEFMRVQALLLFTLVIRAAAQTSATIDIDTTTKTPVNPGFGGVNDEASDPIEYWDTRFNALAARLNYGWVRFPGGITCDAYNWKTGQEEPSWVIQFANDKVANVLLPESERWMAGKGGARLMDAANRARLFGASLLMCVNGFTDTPDSIGQMAAYAKANGIPVAAWELSNEAYNMTEFFPNATVYLTKMKPYRDAIKAADPNALVAVFFDDPGRSTNPNPPWDNAAGAYPDRYWDLVTYHYYPAKTTGDFAAWMADENAVLATKTDAYVTGHLAPLNPPGMKFLVSEFNPSMGNAAGTSTDSLTNGTLYGGIYAAEFVMRMSKLPSVLRVGPHAISSFAGVLSTNEHYADVTAAANAGTTIDTSKLDFGFYCAAEAVGLGVLYGVINQSVQSAKTTVTGGSSVAATGVGQIPALFAMTYRNQAGGWSVVVTNKGATAHQVTMRVNGSAVAGPLSTQFVTATDPSTINTSSNPNAIAVQAGNSLNPVMVPPYSVMRVDLSGGVQSATLSVSSTHIGSFLQGQSTAAYTISIQNSGPGATSGAVSATDTLPAGLTATAINGPGWACALPTLTCSRSDALAPGGSYPPITITIGVASNAVSPVTNQVSVSGGGSATATASDPATIIAAFTDVSPSDSFLPAIDLLKEYNITHACQDLPPQYCPNDNITEAQMAVFVVRSVMGNDNFTYTPTPYFSDVPANNLYFPWIQKMQDLGIALPCGSNQYCPDTPVTRGIMAVLIIRGRYGVATPSTYPGTPYFTDVGPSHPYFPWIQKMGQLGITSGCTATTYCPDDPVTRGQMAVFIVRGEFNLLLPADIPVVAWASPASASPGQTAVVTIMGQNTNFSNGVTQVNADAGITVSNISVASGTTLTAQFAVAFGAALGPRSITVATGSEEATLPNGFRIQ